MFIVKKNQETQGNFFRCAFFCYILDSLPLFSSKQQVIYQFLLDSYKTLKKKRFSIEFSFLSDYSERPL